MYSLVLVLFQSFNVYIFIGDEVLEWNGCLLQGKSQKEVSDIIAESKHLPQIELKVSRSILPRRASYGTPTKGMPTF